MDDFLTLPIIEERKRDRKHGRFPSRRVCRAGLRWDCHLRYGDGCMPVMCIIAKQVPSTLPIQLPWILLVFAIEILWGGRTLFLFEAPWFSHQGMGTTSPDLKELGIKGRIQQGILDDILEFREASFLNSTPKNAKNAIPENAVPDVFSVANGCACMHMITPLPTQNPSPPSSSPSNHLNSRVGQSSACWCSPTHSGGDFGWSWSQVLSWLLELCLNTCPPVGIPSADQVIQVGSQCTSVLR